MNEDDITPKDYPALFGTLALNKHHEDHNKEYYANFLEAWSGISIALFEYEEKRRASPQEKVEIYDACLYVRDQLLKPLYGSQRDERFIDDDFTLSSVRRHVGIANISKPHQNVVKDILAKVFCELNAGFSIQKNGEIIGPRKIEKAYSSYSFRRKNISPEHSI